MSVFLFMIQKLNEIINSIVSFYFGYPKVRKDDFMKYILSLVISLAFVLCGCANDIEPNTKDYEESSSDSAAVSNETSSVSSDTMTDVPSESSTKKSSSASAEPLRAGKSVDLSKLDNTLIGYGQGVIVDSENRPQGAIDFNEKYSKYNAIAMAKVDSKKKESKKTVYLTFDQGYENGFTSKILDTLKEKKVKATFFVLQDYAEKNPDLIRRMIDEGHTVGNHSVSHPSMPSISIDEAKEEIMGLHNYIKEKFNYEMTEFRPPKGEFSERILQLANECGYKTVMWSFAYADWDVNNQPNEAEALNKVTGAKHDGAIYLLHSVSETNANILGDVIENLKNDGYDFKS